jgi:hypothetical protein
MSMNSFLNSVLLFLIWAWKKCPVNHLIYNVDLLQTNLHWFNSGNYVEQWFIVMEILLGAICLKFFGWISGYSTTAALLTYGGSNHSPSTRPNSFKKLIIVKSEEVEMDMTLEMTLNICVMMKHSWQEDNTVVNYCLVESSGGLVKLLVVCAQKGPHRWCESLFSNIQHCYAMYYYQRQLKINNTTMYRTKIWFATALQNNKGKMWSNTVSFNNPCCDQYVTYKLTRWASDCSKSISDLARAAATASGWNPISRNLS